MVIVQGLLNKFQIFLVPFYFILQKITTLAYFISITDFIEN